MSLGKLGNIKETGQEAGFGVGRGSRSRVTGGGLDLGTKLTPGCLFICR